MRKNQRNRHSSLFFVENRKQIDLSLATTHKTHVIRPILVPITDAAQIELKKLNLEYTQLTFLQATPQVRTQNIYRAHQLINSLINDYSFKHALTYQDFYLGPYLVNYFVNFVALCMNSLTVIKNAIAFYQPSSVYTFNSGHDFSVSYPPVSPENYLLIKHAGLCSDKNIQIHVINSFPSHNFNSKFNPDNLTLFFRQAIDKPLLMTYTLFKIYFRHYSKKVLKQSEVLLFADRHVLVNAIPLIKKLKINHLTTEAVGVHLLLKQNISMSNARIEYTDYYLNTTKVVAGKIANILLADWINFSKKAQYTKLLDQFDMTFLEPLITDKISHVIEHNSNEFYLHFKKATYLLQQVRPKKLLVFSNYGKLSLSFCLAAKLNQIKIFILQHGIIPIPKTIYTDNFDKIMVWGKKDFKIHHAHLGIPKGKIIPIGWYYIENDLVKLLRLRQKIRLIPKRSFRMLYVLNNDLVNNGYQIPALETIINSLRFFRNAQLIIRPHPGHFVPQEISKAYPGDISNRIKWDKGQNLNDQLLSADIIITQATTVGLQAMLLHKPLIQLHPKGVIDISHYSKYGAAIKVTNTKEIISVIRSMQMNSHRYVNMIKGQDKYLKFAMMDTKGYACQRIVDELSK